MITMKLAEFRADLTDVIDALEKTGPVRLEKYNDTVAEIRSATPEGERQYTKDVLDTFRYLAELDPNLTDELVRLGVDTLPALTELAARHKEFVDSGVTFDDYPENCLTAEGPATVDEMLAHLYFGDNCPETTENPYDWFLACIRLQKEAAERGLDTEVPCPNAWDASQPTFVDLAISSGHTPDSLVEFGIRALDQGVALERLADMLGSEPVPADVLAMKEYNDYKFENLTENGLPHAEAVTVFRRGLSADAAEWAKAGLRTANEIEQVTKEKTSLGLALRATQDGLTPDQWRVQVPMIQHLKYRGAARGSSRDEKGALHFSLLVQAAEEKISLVRWDSNSMVVDEQHSRPDFHADAARRQGMYPWRDIYPDRVLGMAAARISPSYITAFGKLMRHQYGQYGDGFADLALQAHAAGLTTDMANAMVRTDAKRTKFSPEQLISVLEEGLADAGSTHYLADRYAEPDQWIKWLRERRERQLMTDAFVATVENTDAWKTVEAAALGIRGLVKSRSRVMHSEVYAKAVVEKFLNDEPLNDHELMTLLVQVRVIAFDNHYLGKVWKEEHGGQEQAIIQLMENFDQTRQKPVNE